LPSRLRPSRTTGQGRHRRILAVLLIVAAALPIGLAAGAAAPPDLFGPGVEHGAAAGTLRSRRAEVRFDLAGARGPLIVNLNLFADRGVPTILHRSPENDGVARWTGRVPGHPGTAVVLVASGDAMYGNVHLGDDGEYAIASDGGGVIVTEVDRAALGSDVVVYPPLTADTAGPSPLADATAPVLDVMIVWTPEVLATRFGGDAAAGRIWAEARITELGTTLADSQVPGSARLAYAGTADYDENPHTIYDNLYHLTFTQGVDCFYDPPGLQICDPDGELDPERAQRDLLGADLAVLVIDDPYAGITGVAWSVCRAGETPHPSVEDFCSASYGFAVVAFESATSYWTMAHEIGHLLGGFHDEATNQQWCGTDLDCEAEYAEYNRGYRIVDDPDGFATIMAYATNDAPRIGFFSNPDLSWGEVPIGIPIGQAGEADNASHFGVSLPLVAAFRDRVDCRGRTPTIIGTAGADVLEGTEGADVILSFGGDDTINGNGGDDLICAGDGDDHISGGDGKDKIYGQKGADTISGNTKSDRLYGGGGADVIRGGRGTRDRLFGGDGVDDLDGGPGDDDRCTLGETYSGACEVIF
jgi:hypothetical protein